MPPSIEDADMMYLRATPIPRALESLQQTFWGMYPAKHRGASFPPATIITRASADETLFPNDSNCRRFAQLSRAFAQRTADRWNTTSEMDYLNNLISKWMPDSSKRVAVDSHPRLSGIMDTINSTLAHGPETRLPKEFYDPKGRKIIEKIGVEEWFSGYQESEEYRSLGIGGLLGDVVERMVGSVEHNGNDGYLEVGGKDGSTGVGRGGEKAIKLVRAFSFRPMRCPRPSCPEPYSHSFLTVENRV
jgi:acid phosphatase